MVAALSALNALAIDVMLPALPDIGRAYQLTTDNDRQLVITAYVALFGVAQLVYGPLADAFGRRSVLLWALAIFMLGSVLCVFAPTFELLLAARALQGVGAAATRVIAVAVVRDLTEGRRMAQVMSMATTVFMIVPIIAPGIGQLLLFVAPWRWIFAALLIYAVIVAAWTFVRLPETLAPENRRAFAPGAITSGYAMVLRDRLMLGYMAASTFLTACLFGYITCSEQIFGEVFDLGAAFPLAFAAIAISIGTFSNSRIVMRFGMRRISTAAMLWFCAVALIHTLMAWAFGDSFCQFMALMALGFLVFGLMTSNFSALAMTNMGHIAGSASALFGAVTATFGAILGALIARAFDGTTTPFLIGLTIAALGIITSVFWTERGKLSLSAGR